MPANLITLALAATISTRLETNIITGDNHVGCDICRGNGRFVIPAVMGMEHNHGYEWKPPTLKWTVSNVVEIQTLKLDWNGPREIQHRTTL